MNEQRIGWDFENTYAQLPDVFYERRRPAAFQDPRLTILNNRLASELGLNLDGVEDQALAAVFSGQAIPDGAVPIAQAYAGHQFGGFTMLGDGRAVLLGEQRTPSGQLMDIQFKGSGRTAYSRSGDGLAALGPMLREYLISEAMHALGIPTTRSLAVVTTGEPVYRESTLPGAVLTRVASSHLRVGTFQYAAARQEYDDLKLLADFAIHRHDADLAESQQPYLDFLSRVAERQAALIARWQMVGFIHGVMNTDNMAISGETIDYGPCAFMDTYHPMTVFSSIDHGGRYAYANQPPIAQWNLARLAETLLPLIDRDEKLAVDKAMGVLDQFPDRYQQHWLAGMRSKLGWQAAQEDDANLIEELLNWMQEQKADFTHTFDQLTRQAVDKKPYDDEEFQRWHAAWQARVESEGETVLSASARMAEVNPAVIPRNFRVEEVLAAATQQDDLAPLNEFLAALSSPFDRNAQSVRYAELPPPTSCRYRTFCGT